MRPTLSTDTIGMHPHIRAQGIDVPEGNRTAMLAPAMTSRGAVTPRRKSGPDLHIPESPAAIAAAEALQAAVPEVRDIDLGRMAREIDNLPRVDDQNAAAARIKAEIDRLGQIKDVWERAIEANRLAEECRVTGGLARLDRDQAVIGLLAPYQGVQDEHDDLIEALEDRVQRGPTKGRMHDELLALKEARREAMRQVKTEAADLGMPVTPKAVGDHIGITRGLIASQIRKRANVAPGAAVMDRDLAFRRGPEAHAEVATMAALRVAAEKVRNRAIHTLLAPVRDGGLAIPNVEIAGALGLTTARVAQMRYESI